MNIEDPDISRTLARLIQNMPFEKRFTFLEDAKKHASMDDFAKELKVNKNRMSSLNSLKVLGKKEVFISPVKGFTGMVLMPQVNHWTVRVEIGRDQSGEL